MRSLTPSSAVFPAASGMTYSIPFRSLLDIGDRIRERAAEGAINHEAIARRRHNRRGRGRAVDITREDRLEEIRVLFVGDGMNLGLESFAASLIPSSVCCFRFQRSDSPPPLTTALLLRRSRIWEYTRPSSHGFSRAQ